MTESKATAQPCMLCDKPTTESHPILGAIHAGCLKLVPSYAYAQPKKKK